MVLPDNYVDIATHIILLANGYQTFKAIESEDKDDDIQWLTFWLIYSIVSFLEVFADYLFSWIPFYPEIKIAFIIFLGFFKGARLLYKNVVRPFLIQKEGAIDKQIVDLKLKAQKYTKLAEELAKQKSKEAGEYINKKRSS